MDNPRPEKVAVVEEVRDRFASSDGALLTEYRGMTVAELAELRTALAAAGGEYKVYKNTLVRLAVADRGQDGIDDLLTGPTAIAFVQGDVSAVAKALRTFAKENPNLIVKGGLVGSGLLSANEVDRLADLPSRETMLAQLAGGLQAPMQKMAGLMQALTRNFAYGLSALIDQQGGAPAEASTDEATSDEAPATESTDEAPEATTDEAPEATTDESPAEEPAAETPAEEAVTDEVATDEAGEAASDEAPAEEPAAE